MRQLLAAVALCLALPLAPQAAPAQGSLPSRFRVAVQGAELLFSWEAAADPAGGWELLRSPAAFSPASLPAAELVQKLPAAQRSLSYRPSDGKAWYYALLPLDAAGKALAELEAGKTMTALAIAIPADAVAAAPAPASTAAAAKQVSPAASGPAAAPSVPAAGSTAPAETASPAPDKPGIYELTATLAESSLRLGFVFGKGTGSVLVYRSSRPFSDATSLLSASLIASLPETTRSFMDFPIPGSPYYYALVSESQLRSGNLSFSKEGGSASIGPLSLSASSDFRPLPETGELARSYPLPSWLFAKPGDPGLGVEPAAISSQTEKAIAAILSPYPKTSPRAPAPALLSEDRSQPRGGEEYALSLILRGSVKAGSWTKAAEELRSYLSLNRSPALASRAHFYLGQAYALTGQYRDAFFEFLLARDFHAAETRPWLLWLVAVERG